MKALNKLQAIFNKEGSVVYKATAWFFLCNIFQKGLHMITVPIFARIMTEEQMGYYTAYQTWSSIIIILTTLRLDYGVFNKGMSKYPEKHKEYTSTMMLFCSGTAAVWFTIYALFHDFFNSITELSTLVTCALFVELLIVPATWFWSLGQRYEYKYKSVVLVTLLSSVMGTAVSVVAVLYSEEKAVARILSGIVVPLAIGLVIYVITLKKTSKKFDFQYVKFALTFNIPLMPHYFSEYILHQSDKIMIQKLAGEKELGLYGMAHSIASTIQLVTSSMSNALLPWQYEALRKKKIREVEKRITGSVFVVAGIILLFICVAPEALWILASEKYMEAVSVIPPISCSVIMIFYYCLVANVEFYYDKNKFVTVISLVCAVLNIGINFAGLYFMGYLGAAYATFICYSIFGVAHVLYANRVVKEKEGIKMFRETDVILLIVLSSVIIAVMTLLYDYFWIRYILLLVLCVPAFIFRNKIIGLIKGKSEGE